MDVPTKSPVHAQRAQGSVRRRHKLRTYLDNP
jgi:hypothetical protein